MIRSVKKKKKDYAVSWSDKLFFWSVSVRRSGSLSLGVAHPFFSQAFRIHAVVILIFLWGVSAGITRMETSFFLFLSLQHCSHAKNAKLLWRGSLFQALVEVSGLIFMDVQSPLGIVTTFRWVYTNPPTPTPPPPPPPFFFSSRSSCVFSSLAYFSGLMDCG